MSLSLTTARAIAVRCCWPPESSDRLALQHRRQAQEFGGLADAPLDFGCVHAGHAQRRGDVLVDVEIRIVDELLVDHRTHCASAREAW